jgi:putative phage-type endonuclease
MIKQRTPEWFRQRLGVVTASKVADVISKGATRQTYMDELLAQIITQRVEPGYTNAAMQWGVDQEPHAIAAYECATGEFVHETGLHMHPRIAQSGASPDGLVNVGLVEAKCPQTATHLGYVQSKRVPGRYITQMQWQMACTELPWCDFLSFDPRVPDHLQLLVIRVERDIGVIQILEHEVQVFIEELNHRVNQLKDPAP